MAILRVDIERALNELVSQENGMRFQGLAVALGKKRWPELIARQRKKDFGLDAYAPASLTPERIGKGLAASVTPTLKKVSDDAKEAKDEFTELQALLFVTSAKVGNADRKRWEQAIRKDYGLELHVIEREEIISMLLMPENAQLCASHLYLNVAAEPVIADLIARTRRAAATVARTWAVRTKGHPLIDLTARRINPDDAQSAEGFSLDEIDRALSQSRRIVLEAPAGRGKTTTLIQLAQRPRAAGTAFIVELPAWTSSRRRILEYIAGMPAFQAEGLTVADLARVQQTEPFLFLLNGWNEIAESNSTQADDTLRELERDFPTAGIIAATRTHHLTPPLPGALWLRLERLRRFQRSNYLTARLGTRVAALRTRIDADASLDDLTRSPFILSEVTALFEAGAEIPSTKFGVLSAVLRLQEQREEHRNALQAEPVFGRQADYLKVLATEMTRRGGVSLSEADARDLVGRVARELADHGHIRQVAARDVLAALTAHHVLERVEYPRTAFQFEHQQLQEYYAATDVHSQLVNLVDGEGNTALAFIGRYVNEPAWAEPLRMIAETLSEATGDSGADKKNIQAGRMLIEMTLAVDPVFASELAQLCGSAVWKEVLTAVGERLRAIYDLPDRHYQECALAAMLATGSDDFADILLPLLASTDQQIRLHTYRLWPEIAPAVLGPDWRKKVGAWPDEVRADFVSELLHHRVEPDVAAFAADDKSGAVKKAAASSLLWTRSDDAAIHVLDSMDEETFADFVRQHSDFIPPALRRRTVGALGKFMESTADEPARLRTALELIQLGEQGLEGVVKDAMAALPRGDMRNLESYYIQPGLEYLRKTDPAWASEWVAEQVAEGVLYSREHWMQFAPVVPAGLVDKYLERLETKDLKNKQFGGIVAVIVAGADANIAARIFAKLRELRRKVDAEPNVRHEFEWQVMNQLEAVFRGLPDDIAVAGVLDSVTAGEALDIRVAADLLSRVARSDQAPLEITNGELKARLRDYLKGSLNLVLRQDDFNGEGKANLASSIAQVGKAEDLTDLLTLIRADIDRVRRGRAARAAGDHGPLGNGGSMSYAGWHIAALLHLDAPATDRALMDLLPEPEYLSDVATAMARDFLPKPELTWDTTFRYELMWAAREGRIPALPDDERQQRYAAALNGEIKRLREQVKDGKPATGLKELAKALAAIDGRASVQAVVDSIVIPGHYDEYTRLDAAERLLMAGVVLPTNVAFALLDPFLQRTEKWMQGSDKHLLRRLLALCAFVDDAPAGIAKMRAVLAKKRLYSYELREIVTALGESRSDAAVDVLHELAADAQTFEKCEDNFINAFAALDTPRAREFVIGLVDPDVRTGVVLKKRPYREDVLIARLTELARREPAIAARLRGFAAKTARDFASIHANQEPPKGRIRPRKLEDIVMRCLAKDPALRFVDFESLRTEVGNVFAGHTGDAVPKAAVGSQLSREQLGNKGISLDALGYHALAIACYDDVLRVTPNDPRVWINKGGSLGRLGKLQESIACLDRSLTLDSGLWQAWSTRGTVTLQAGDIREAINCYGRALELNPLADTVWNLKGMALIAQDEPLNAVGCFDQAISLNPSSGTAYVGKGVALSAAGYAKRSLFWLYKARHLADTTLRDVAVRGEVAFSPNELAQFQEYTGTKPITLAEQALPQVELSAFQSQVREYLTAEDAAAQDPDDEHKWIRVAILLEDVPLRDEALEWYDKAIRFHPRSVPLLVNKAGVLQDLDRKAEALQCLEKALKIDPVSKAAWRNKGSILIDLRRFEEAIVSFEEAKRLGDPEAARGIVFCREKLGGDEPDSLVAKALRQLERGQVTEALAMLDKALQSAPEYVQAWLNKGVCLVHLNRAEQALVCFNRCLSLKPDLAEAWLNKGAVLGELGKHREALECFMQAKRLGLSQADRAIAICRRNLDPPAAQSTDDSLDTAADKWSFSEQPKCGTVKFAPNGSTVIVGTTEYTALHWMGHVVARSLRERLSISKPLSDAEWRYYRRCVETWLRIRDGRWTDLQEERFAEEFEQFADTKVAENIKFRPMRRVSRPGLLAPSIREMFDRVIGNLPAGGISGKKQ